ncbi:3-hydroxyacyl-CoA dehydrogenase NAD-binding domain-containing protein [Micromonospora endophytica]|uniref:Hydroxylacyl-CoA dehydrogenase n=1 Tax=Micromonospora endophytica TaxID=515350 RepID=A0A2W2CNY4_9ACTN|nr:3-hydroxyacyl-CoA dehydrogenase NAD-binding domain-containing protein [Micromonospora endophytica]PZG01212.1 hydroxylacyl-CoA dehydrogenase [Micromonospora endophytica]RIW45847.1 hydroxylacyl-CoA dehydrogenase [Micromonospora endophytica]BCJ61885.1 hydroxylacyl-CoA dehydrogenase [Micromonospora endophytica]
MSAGRPTRVTVIGAGTIGLGWIALFAAHGLDVIVNSRRPEAERIVVDQLRLFAETMPGGPRDPAELAARLRFVPDLATAVADAEVVQENAPEDRDLKRDLYLAIAAAAPPGALLLSSTSTMPPDEIASDLDDPGRVVVGHPFNPPHVIPLVEVVGGTRTQPQAIAEAVAFYRSVGKVPVVLRKPVPRFVANRLQSALLQECIHLVREGVVTMEELDRVVTHSIGLRWATVGPFEAFHLGGGAGGLRRWLTHLGRGLEQSWQELGHPRLTEECIDFLGAEADRTYGSGNHDRLSVERDLKQNAVIDALSGIESQRRQS